MTSTLAYSGASWLIAWAVLAYVAWRVIDHFTTY